METIFLYTIATLTIVGFVVGLAWLEKAQNERLALLNRIHGVTK
jgi:hypothetical protein